MDELEPISNLLAAAMPQSGDRPAAPAVQQRLADFWRAQTAADAPGMQSFPLLFTSGRLVVFVESAAHGHTIRHRAPSIIEALGQHGIHVTGLTVKTQPPALPLMRAPRPRTKLSRQTSEHIAALTNAIDRAPRE